MKKKLLVVAVIITVIFIGGGLFYVFNNNESESPKPQPNNQETQEAEPALPAPDKKEPIEAEETPSYDTTTPSIVTFIANKSHPLPADYVPSDLATPDVRLRLSPSAEQMQFRQTASAALKEMFDAAKADGVELVFGSGYRSYSLQKQFYDSYVERDGQAAADRYSARPGTSEHQTGLSFDVTSPSQTCHLEICFEDTPEGKWMAKNAHSYGFVLRYLEGKESITGYQYEPWHFRYIGHDIADKVHKQNITLEEFFGLSD